MPVVVADRRHTLGSGGPIGGRGGNWRQAEDFMKTSLTSRGSLLLITLSTLAACLDSTAGAFQNGSFESPTLAPGSGSALAAGSTLVTGWTVGGTGVVSLVNGPFFGVSPAEGNQEVVFNGGDGPTGG